MDCLNSVRWRVGNGTSRGRPDKQYGPGLTDTEIKVGQTSAYSGPAWAYGTLGKTEVAYQRMTNARGDINGRNINLISLDDGYSPT